MPTAIRAVIFDLDGCLAAADEPGPGLLEPAFAAIRAANHGELADDALESALAECWRHSLDVVARRHRFSEAMYSAGTAACAAAEVSAPMHGYGDLAALDELAGQRLFLVTTGFRRLQQSKVRALGIGKHFERVVIDALDEKSPPGKQRIFEELLAACGLQAAETLVVGDNPEAELAAGTRLGMPTVQTLRPGVRRAATATYHVHSLSELPALIRNHAGPTSR